MSANSERRERIGVNASLENASRNNDTLDVSNVNDETRHNIPDEVSELSVPVTYFDRQPHTHHNLRVHSNQTATTDVLNAVLQVIFYEAENDINQFIGLYF